MHNKPAKPPEPKCSPGQDRTSEIYFCKLLNAAVSTNKGWKAFRMLGHGDWIASRWYKRRTDKQVSVPITAEAVHGEIKSNKRNMTSGTAWEDNRVTNAGI